MNIPTNLKKFKNPQKLALTRFKDITEIITAFLIWQKITF